MLNKKSFFTLTFLTAISIFSLNEVKANQTMSPIEFHDSKTSREWNIIDNKLYHKFLENHPDIQVVSNVIDLNGSGVGSIFIQFHSPNTCNVDGCITTIVSYNQNTKSWTEIFNHRTKEMWIGGVSPSSSGENMKQIVTSDGLLWRWIGKDSYYADLRSISKLWPDSDLHETYGQRKKFAFSNIYKIINEDYKNINKGTFQELSLTLNGVGGQYLMVYNNIDVCSMSLGCPYMIINGGGDNYKIIGNGWYNGLGGTITSEKGTDNFNPIVVQFGDGLNYYNYDGKYYQLYKTTYPSKVTRTP